LCVECDSSSHGQTVKDHNTSNGLIPICFFLLLLLLLSFQEKGGGGELEIEKKRKKRQSTTKETQRWSNLFSYLEKEEKKRKKINLRNSFNSKRKR
jgi:hypothetical protein